MPKAVRIRRCVSESSLHPIMAKSVVARYCELSVALMPGRLRPEHDEISTTRRHTIYPHLFCYSHLTIWHMEKCQGSENNKAFFTDPASHTDLVDCSGPVDY